MTPQEQRSALTEMVQSDGWALYLAHIEEAWGPAAFERALDAALLDCPPDEEKAIASRIRDTFKGVRRDVQWPAERAAMLAAGPDAAVASSGLFRRFAAGRVTR